jgi:hypothetical protein
MSPEEWLAQQPKTSPRVALSPEEWLAQQNQAQPQPTSATTPAAVAAKPVADEEAGDFMRGVGNIPGQLQETFGGAKALAGLLSNSKGLIESGLMSMEEGKLKQSTKQSDSFTDAWTQGIGTVLTDWLPYQLALV